MAGRRCWIGQYKGKRTNNIIYLDTFICRHIQTDYRHTKFMWFLSTKLLFNVFSTLWATSVECNFTKRKGKSFGYTWIVCIGRRQVKYISDLRNTNITIEYKRTQLNWRGVGIQKYKSKKNTYVLLRLTDRYYIYVYTTGLIDHKIARVLWFVLVVVNWLVNNFLFNVVRLKTHCA